MNINSCVLWRNSSFPQQNNLMSTNLSNLQICVPTKIQQERHATVWTNYSTSQEKHHSNLQHKKNSRPLQSKEQYTVYATKTIQRIFLLLLVLSKDLFVREWFCECLLVYLLRKDRIHSFFNHLLIIFIMNFLN
jgi:hypothetical protein